MSDANTEALLQRRYRVLGRHSPLFYDKPLHLVKGEGVWVWDADGRRYLDAYNNVPHVGHSHPHVVEALSRQAAILNTHTRYLHEGILEYAERLLSTFDASLSNIVFVCTGTEANELALRIARDTTGHEGIISSAWAYHGNSAAVAQISSLFTPPEQRLYSWWSYRSPNWEAADRGRRLDHIWVSPSLGEAVVDAQILKEARGWERPSDHVPIFADFAA